MVSQGFQQGGGLADPIGEGGPVEVQPFAVEDLALACRTSRGRTSPSAVRSRTTFPGWGLNCPHAWLADTIARFPDCKITKVDDLLLWRWNG